MFIVGLIDAKWHVYFSYMYMVEKVWHSGREKEACSKTEIKIEAASTKEN